MENMNMASPQQLNYLKRLGYTGNENLTSTQASELIKKYVAAQGQQQPTQQQQTYNAGYQQPQQNNNPIASYNNKKEIQTRAGESIEVTPELVRQYIGVDLTTPEFSYFFNVCNTYGLNPFLKDIYPIKFGNQPATFVIDYKVMQQAADENPMFDGLKVGLLFLNKDGIPEERDGAYLLPNEKLLGAWCEVYRKDRTHTNRTYALYEENKKLTKDGTVNSNWKDKPVFMITKVAKAQALRETFPNMFSNNTYVFEEMEEEKKKNPERKYNQDEVIDAQVDENGVIQPNLEDASNNNTEDNGLGF